MAWELFEHLWQFDIPLALGWPLAIWMFVVNYKANRALNERLFNIIKANTHAMTKLSDHIGFWIGMNK